MPDICEICGGKCCRRSAGISWPADFGRPIRPAIQEALKSGWVIAELEGVLVVRPKYKEENYIGIGNVPACSAGECGFLTETGCSAPVKPTQCRELKEQADMECKITAPFDNADAKRIWLPYQKTLCDLLQES